MTVEVVGFDAAIELTPAQEKLINADGLKPQWRPLRDEMFQKLQAERPDCDTVTLMTLERVSFIYTKMRQMEAAGVSIADHKEFMNMFNKLIESLNKIDEKQQVIENMRIESVQMVVSMMKEATEGLPKEQQQAVMSRVLKAAE